MTVFGIGGVGGYTVEALARSGIGTQRRQVPGSNAFVPAVVGSIIAGEVTKDLSACRMWGSAIKDASDPLHILNDQKSYSKGDTNHAEAF